MEIQTKNVFILTDEWQDIKGKNTLIFTGRSEDCPVEIIIDNNKPVFFVEKDIVLTALNVPHKRKNVNMKNFTGIPVDAIYFNTEKDLKTAEELLSSKEIATYESDVNPARRFLMEKSINAQMSVTGSAIKKDKLLSFTNPDIKPANFFPNFIVASLDIETGEKNNLLYSIAVSLRENSNEIKKVFMLSNTNEKLSDYVECYPSEKELLQNFMNWFRDADPDIIIGWHVIGFDLLFLDSKCKEFNFPFDIARAGGRVTIRKRTQGSYFANIPGRIVLDGPFSLRTSFHSFEDFKLETVSQELLGIGKTISPNINKVAEIEKLFKRR